MSKQIHATNQILFEDEYVLVLNKPAGLMVEPDRNGHPNLLNQVKKYLQESFGHIKGVYAQHIHRLDRPVSGIILFAKQKNVLKNLSEQFAERRVRKYYQALTTQAPALKTGILEHWHRKEKKKAVLYQEEVPFAEKAILMYDVTYHKEKFLWNLELNTGKYHQIRAQLASAGCPIIGDTLYGSTDNYISNSIALHACRLSFFHPISGEQIIIENNIEF